MVHGHRSASLLLTHQPLNGQTGPEEIQSYEFFLKKEKIEKKRKREIT